MSKKENCQIFSTLEVNLKNILKKKIYNRNFLSLYKSICHVNQVHYKNYSISILSISYSTHDIARACAHITHKSTQLIRTLFESSQFNDVRTIEGRPYCQPIIRALEAIQTLLHSIMTAFSK